MSNSLEVAMTVPQTKCLTTLCPICAMYCTNPSTLCTSSLLNFQTYKHPCNLNDASHSASPPSMHAVKYVKDLMYINNYGFRSRYNELLQIIFKTNSKN